MYSIIKHVAMDFVPEIKYLVGYCVKLKLYYIFIIYKKCNKTCSYGYFVGYCVKLKLYCIII